MGTNTRRRERLLKELVQSDSPVENSRSTKRRCSSRFSLTAGSLLCLLVTRTLRQPPSMVPQDDDRADMRPLSWEWHYYSTNGAMKTSTYNTTSSSTAQQQKQGRLLVAQYAGHGAKYEALLNVTRTVNHAYTKLYHGDFAILRGIGIRAPVHDWFHPPDNSRAAYNKITILQKAIDKGYDYLLLIDSDALVYDFSRDIRTLLLPDKDGQPKLLLAHHVKGPTWNINNGVTLWNLNHPQAQFMARAWKQKALIRIRKRRPDGDQGPLQAVLRDHMDWVQAESDEFNHRQGQFARHFTRGNSGTHGWTETNVQTREAKIRQVAREVCQRYAPACDGVV